MQTFYLIKMCEILDLIIKKFLEFKNLRWKNVHAAVSRTKPILPIYSDFPNQAWLKCKPHSKFHREILYFDNSKTSPQVFTLKIELLHHCIFHIFGRFSMIQTFKLRNATTVKLLIYLPKQVPKAIFLTLQLLHGFP